MYTNKHIKYLIKGGAEFAMSKPLSINEWQCNYCTIFNSTLNSNDYCKLCQAPKPIVNVDVLIIGYSIEEESNINSQYIMLYKQKLQIAKVAEPAQTT